MPKFTPAVQELENTFSERQTGPFVDRGGSVGFDARAYGAVLDGTTDDGNALADAITAAQASGIKAVTVAGGTALVGSALTVPKGVTLRVPEGAKLKPANGVTVTINGAFEAGLYQVFDTSAGGTIVFGPGAVERVLPQWWGAKGDGVTDDTAAIQAALDAVSAADGGVVHLPRGTFNLSNRTALGNDPTSLISLSVPGNVIIEGSGPGTVLNVTTDDTAAILLEGVSGVTIRNLKITGPGQTGAAHQPQGIRLSGVSNVVLHNCEVSGFGTHNVAVRDGSSNVVIDSCFLHDAGTWNGLEVLDSSDVVVVASVIRDNADQGIEIKNSHRVRVIGCIIEGNGFKQPGAAPKSGIGIESGASDCAIIGNVIRGNYSDGIAFAPYTADCNNNVIVANHIANNGRHGVFITSQENSVDAHFTALRNIVANNQIKGNAEAGVRIRAAHENTVEGNLIEGNGTSGVQVVPFTFQVTERTSERCVVRGNRLYRNGEHGIYGDTAHSILVEGNHAQDNNQDAGSFDSIHLIDTDDALVLGNVASGARYGVRVSGGTSALVAQNRLAGSTGAALVDENCGHVVRDNPEYGPVNTPAVLEPGSTHNYPIGAAYTTLRLRADAAGSTLTGFQGGYAGRRLRVVNVSENTLTIAHQSPSSDDANRIITNTGANLTLAQHEVADLEYDAVTGKWRAWKVG